jgi:geranylgeranyl reductase family protein
LAYLLAVRGLQVLILEKARFPRPKPCGGGVTLKAVRSLPFDASQVFEVQAEAGRLSFQGRPVVRARLERPAAWLVMRDRFDQFLAEQAAHAGARLVQGITVRAVEELANRVIVRTEDGGAFAGRLLAGADGVHSTVARSVGLMLGRCVGTALEAEIDVPDADRHAQGADATFDFGALPGGYGWIFPKRDHLSIGVFDARGGKSPALKAHLRQFVASHALLRNARWLTVRGHRIPLGGRRQALHAGRTLLVGDAANLADPWLGEGIYYAVASARVAAGAMCDALAEGALDLSAYTARVNAEITGDFAYARRLGYLVYRFPRLCSIWLARSPLLQEAVFGVIRGDETFQKLYRRMVRQLPRILVETVASPAAAQSGEWSR